MGQFTVDWKGKKVKFDLQTAQRFRHCLNTPKANLTLVKSKLAIYIRHKIGKSTLYYVLSIDEAISTKLDKKWKADYHKTC